MIDEEEFHYPFTCFFHHWRVCVYNGGFTVFTGPEVFDCACAGSDRFWLTYDFNKAHTAITGNGQALVKAKAWDFGARLLTGLQKREGGRHIDFSTIDDKFGHDKGLTRFILPFKACS
jgi:hypothetical protein